MSWWPLFLISRFGLRLNHFSSRSSLSIPEPLAESLSPRCHQLIPNARSQKLTKVFSLLVNPKPRCTPTTLTMNLDGSWLTVAQQKIFWIYDGVKVLGIWSKLYFAFGSSPGRVISGAGQPQLPVGLMMIIYSRPSCTHTVILFVTSSTVLDKWHEVANTLL